jgi:hypothetical protein
MLGNLFEKFGATFELGQFYPAYERKLNAVEPDWLIPGSKAALVDDATFIALCYWCEGRSRDAKTYAAECVKHGVEYFFGKWREEIPTDLKTRDAGWWRIHSTWVTPFREALCWATALGDWKSVQRLAGRAPGQPLRSGSRDCGLQAVRREWSRSQRPVRHERHAMEGTRVVRRRQHGPARGETRAPAGDSGERFRCIRGTVARSPDRRAKKRWARRPQCEAKRARRFLDRFHKRRGKPCEQPFSAVG